MAGIVNKVSSNFLLFLTKSQLNVNGHLPKTAIFSATGISLNSNFFSRGCYYQNEIDKTRSP